MNLNTQCEFAPYYFKFKNCTQEISDIGNLLCTLRTNNSNISYDAMRKILEIPLIVLELQCELKQNESIWASTQGSYFSGNVNPVGNKDPLFKYVSIFASNSFTLQTMYDFLLEISQSSKYTTSDFYMRNPEVTLRDDVVVKKYSNFKECGLIFSRVLEQAFDL